MIETRNAIITSVTLGLEDHGILTAYLHLDYGGTAQGFGGYNLQATGANYCAHFVRRCLETVGVNEWNDLAGKTIRVKAEHIKVHAIGHIVKDKWFDPSAELKEMEVTAKAA